MTDRRTDNADWLEAYRIDGKPVAHNDPRLTARQKLFVQLAALADPQRDRPPSPQ
ncbi:MAG: hypothetical protein GXY33_15880 [Phycisphaerae bacterium]|nr:hypothetical protein [Phycisphaerae bacterium]